MRRLGSIRALTSTIDDAGRISPNSSPWTAVASAEREMSVRNIRVRTTSVSAKPASARARSMISKIARVWAARSPGWRDRPSGPASVVPATQQASPTTIARL